MLDLQERKSPPVVSILSLSNVWFSRNKSEYSIKYFSEDHWGVIHAAQTRTVLTKSHLPIPLDTVILFSLLGSGAYPNHSLLFYFPHCLSFTLLSVAWTLILLSCTLSVLPYSRFSHYVWFILPQYPMTNWSCWFIWYLPISYFYLFYLFPLLCLFDLEENSEYIPSPFKEFSCIAPFGKDIISLFLVIGDALGNCFAFQSKSFP